MKNALYVTAIFLTSSCTQRNYPVPRPVYDQVVVGGYDIQSSSGLISLRDSQTTTLNVFVSLITGNPLSDKAGCFLSGLPARVTISPDTQFSTLPNNFSSQLTLNCDTGYYTFAVNVISSSKGLQSYPMRMHVLGVEDCAPAIPGRYGCAGNYKNLTTGVVSTDSCTINIVSIPAHVHIVNIKNLRGLGDSVVVMAIVGCDHYITIPLQTVYGYTIYGRGGYNLDIRNNQSITLHDTIIIAGDTLTHTGYLWQ